MTEPSTPRREYVRGITSPSLRQRLSEIHLPRAEGLSQWAEVGPGRRLSQARRTLNRFVEEMPKSNTLHDSEARRRRLSIVTQDGVIDIKYLGSVTLDYLRLFCRVTLREKENEKLQQQEQHQHQQTHRIPDEFDLSLPLPSPAPEDVLGSPIPTPVPRIEPRPLPLERKPFKSYLERILESQRRRRTIKSPVVSTEAPQPDLFTTPGADSPFVTPRIVPVILPSVSLTHSPEIESIPARRPARASSPLPPAAEAIEDPDTNDLDFNAIDDAGVEVEVPEAGLSPVPLPEPLPEPVHEPLPEIENTPRIIASPEQALDETPTQAQTPEEVSFPGDFGDLGDFNPEQITTPQPFSSSPDGIVTEQYLVEDEPSHILEELDRLHNETPQEVHLPSPPPPPPPVPTRPASTNVPTNFVKGVVKTVNLHNAPSRKKRRVERIGRETSALLRELSEDFLSSVMGDLEAYAKHRGSKQIAIKDAVLYLNRISNDDGTEIETISKLARNFLPRELLVALDNSLEESMT